MTMLVYIDSCAWNYLHDNSIDLERELPSSDFAIYVTREVEVELGTIPDVGKDGLDRTSLKNYIKINIDRRPVKTSYTFGFQTMGPDGDPSPIQVYGGFDVGAWQSPEERDFYDNSEIIRQLKSGKRNSGLGKNQTDASLASKSFSSIILTNELDNSPGPLKFAAALGGKVVYLSSQVKSSGLTIGEYLKSVF